MKKETQLLYSLNENLKVQPKHIIEIFENSIEYRSTRTGLDRFLEGVNRYQKDKSRETIKLSIGQPLLQLL